MKVLVSAILAKIPELPPNVRDLVTISSDSPRLADVKSRTSDTLYRVHIEPHVDDPGNNSILNTTCPCDARKLCWHVTAFYAVSKNLLPPIAPEKPSDTQQPPEDVEPVQVANTNNVRTLTRLTKEAIHTDLLAHEARSAMLDEVLRLLEQG